MKRLAVTLCLVAAMAAIPPQPKLQAQESPQAVNILVACGVVLLIGAGVVTVVGVVKLCRNIASNRNWAMTNAVGDSMLLPELNLDATTNPSGPVHLQSSAGLGTVFSDDVVVSMTQEGNVVTGVASQEGIPVLTNSATVDSNGWVTLDFRSLETTNTWPMRFWRLAQ